MQLFFRLIFLIIKQFAKNFFFVFYGLEGFLITFFPSCSLKSEILQKKKKFRLIDFFSFSFHRNSESRFFFCCVAKLENNSVERKKSLIDQEETSKNLELEFQLNENRANRAYQKMEIIQSSHRERDGNFSNFFFPTSHRCQEYISTISSVQCSSFVSDVCCQNEI